MDASDNSDTETGQPAKVEAALLGLCPRCGAKTLFAGILRFADRCPACGLDYNRFNVGDGPAALVTLAVGTITVGLAIWLQLAAEPDWWVHVLLWGPLTLGLVMGGLRITKGFLLQSEYRNNAGEAGRRKP
ncbi:DUF983 domain-containing protein [Qipengyuania marisflavi]|uniref:DUF983 domain-containing protein n=1 Tax=Qipengyuania marisflavi TaxID=2486356 RepID=A0A5S3P6U5_9SPHN|nr:DUF983 domain-containing protein [Qipengyuania marisflavi]TMM48958.1 DUF983 domain-containing protein [Qipengyuania marisflavi]